VTGGRTSVTVVIAHRTLPRDAPENSLEGIQAAAASGADYVEVDVRRTRDGVPVLLHDPSLLRTGWKLRRIRSMTLDDVARVKLRGGHVLPTLADALAQAPDGLGFALDTKDPGAAPATLAAVEQAEVTDRILLWSKHEEAVRHYVARAPEGTEVALLRDTKSQAETDQYFNEAVRLGATAVSVHQDVLDHALVDQAHDRGLKIHCWFQSLDVQAARAQVPVDGIVTDWPKDAAERLTALGRR
jgi:glycerophosphoryl diester phosphodiesterase